MEMEEEAVSREKEVVIEAFEKGKKTDSPLRARADRGIGGVRPVAPPTWLVSNFLVRPASS